MPSNEQISFSTAKVTLTWVIAITLPALVVAVLMTRMIFYPDVPREATFASIVIPLIIAPFVSVITSRMWLRMAKLHQKATRATDKADKATQELKDVMKKQQLLFSIIGHEVRTPATSIKMMVEEPEFLRQKHALDSVRRSANHLVSVLDDMRALANPDLPLDGTIAVSRPADLIKNAADAQGMLASKQGMAMHIEMDDALRYRFQYHTKILRQVVINLVRNSLLHSGGKAITITGKPVEGSSDRFEIRFSDNGSGIQGSDHEAIFHPYKRGNSKSFGLGLGLHICRDFLRKYMNGDLWYEDTPGGGATFVAVFQADVAPLVQEGEELPKYDFTGKRVLIVDDNEIIRIVSRMSVEKLGATVDEAENGKEGLKLAQDNEYDVILSDLYMPQMDGDEMVRQLRAADRWETIVGITAATVSDDTVRFVEAGADLVLEKPLVIERLQEKLAMLDEGETVAEERHKRQA